jgi:hypothetical protein
VVAARCFVGISEYEKSTLKVKKKYLKIWKNVLWKLYFLNTADSLFNCGHINKLWVVKISNIYLQ